MNLIEPFNVSDYVDDVSGFCHARAEVRVVRLASMRGFRLGQSINPHSARVRRSLKREIVQSSHLFAITIADRYAVRVCARYNRMYGREDATREWMGLSLAYWSIV